ncbi:tyrosine-type recombinase/integrase [Sphingomonas parapaucimobilis]|uniref:tyrosine-type recombinase/integrase n=1 Tax=Sphingomonas parapaucimobilis TaxID=28213 RepID=UPI00391DEF29
MSMMVIGRSGERKYLTNAERSAFLREASLLEPDTFTLCSVISATGCRISEALSLTSANIDTQAKVIVIECLKKRRKGVFRTIPVSSDLIALLCEVHDLQPRKGRKREASPLWPFSRMTAYRRIRKAMDAAGLNGAHAMPKGLRHGFGVTAIHSQVPLNLVQRWLGHADMRTTALYANAVGPEERSIALRMWRKAPSPAQLPVAR